MTYDPVPYDPNYMPAPSGRSTGAVSRSIARHETAAYVQLHRELVDATCHQQVVVHASALGMLLVDDMRAMAGNDPLKAEIGISMLSSWLDSTNRRIGRMYGGGY